MDKYTQTKRLSEQTVKINHKKVKIVIFAGH